MSKDRDARFEARLRSRLAASIDGLDESTRQSLRDARRRALAAVPSASSRLPRWLPAGALAASLALLVMFALVGKDERPGAGLSGGDIIAATDAVDDFELLIVDEDLELIEELEFFRWLDAGGDSG